MKKIITYGTFDLLHYGHIRLLERAKELGDYLVVGVTSDTYDKGRGKLNVKQSLVQRIENVRNTGLADEIIVEEYEGQKIDDIKKYDIDIFTVGSDWNGKFDYLKEYCEVVYLERTKGISSTELRNKDSKIINIGIIGSGRIANRFVIESKYVSGIDIKGVFNPDINAAEEFCKRHELNFASNNIDEFYSKVDAVYIATPHNSHTSYIEKSLDNNKDVICEKPISLNSVELERLYNKAREKKLVLMEAIKTAYCPAFKFLISLLKSGAIGEIKEIQACFTKLVTDKNTRELKAQENGGSVTELASYTILPIIKLLGTNYENVKFYSYFNSEVDLFTHGIIKYNNAIATFKVGLGVKSEGDLVISGTKGYAYIQSPWWKTEYFEIRTEDLNKTKKYFYKFEEDGLRYEINKFVNLINNRKEKNIELSAKESIEICRIIESFLQKKDIEYIK